MRPSQEHRRLTLVFDGGSKGNPGFGYGSFRLEDWVGRANTTRLEFGDNVTNNQAEYRTFIAGLEAAIQTAHELNLSPANLVLVVRSDSRLVVEQVLGRWKVKNLELQPLRERARQLLDCFGAGDVQWQPRQTTVRLLGH